MSKTTFLSLALLLACLPLLIMSEFSSLLPQSLSVHKQSLQSEYSLIKGTNLSLSNQVAELAGVADNSLAL